MLLVCWKNSHEDWSVHSCVPLSILSIRFLLLMLKISAGNWCSVVIVISPTRITFTRHERKKSEMSWNHAPIFSLILVTSSLRAFSTVNSSVTVNSSRGMVSRGSEVVVCGARNAFSSCKIISCIFRDLAAPLIVFLEGPCRSFQQFPRDRFQF